MPSKPSSREILLTPTAREDLEYWQNQNPKMLARIDALLKAILLDPEKGIGKPEKLRYELSGYWSRRINHKDRIIYQVFEDANVVLQVRDHY